MIILLVLLFLYGCKEDDPCYLCDTQVFLEQEEKAYKQNLYCGMDGEQARYFAKANSITFEDSLGVYTINVTCKVSLR